MAEPRKDRNASVKPVVVNRNDVSPFELIRTGRGTARDRDRAILAMDRAFEAQIDQFNLTLQGLAEREWALRSYLVAEKEWRALPFWRRWKTPRPPIPLFREIKETEAAKALTAAESRADDGAESDPVPETK